METIDLLKQLIAIESTHEREGMVGLSEVVTYVHQLFTDDTIRVRVSEYHGYPSLVISNTDDTEVDILFSGHLDVVSASSELFVPRIEGDWLYGRGAMDMKAGVAAMIQVFKRHAASNKKLALMLTTDEEIGGFQGTKQLLEVEGYRARVAIIPDGGYRHNHIALKEKGILRISLTTTGTSAHASRPWLGNNAIHTLTQIISEIEAYHQLLRVQAEKTDDLDWYTTINLGGIEGGSAVNSVPDRATAHYDIRFIERDSIDALVAHMEHIVAPYGASISVGMTGANVFVPEDNPYVQQYATAIATCGELVHYTKDFGASDARFFAEYGIPTILSQPYGLDWHGDDERVSIESVHLFEKILDEFVTSFQS